MGAFTSVTKLGESLGGPGRMKMVAFSTVCPASYDTGGSAIDLSTAGGLGADGFSTSVHCVQILTVSPVGSHQYLFTYVPAASGAPATGKVSCGLVYQATPAEVAGSTDLHATTLYGVAFGY